MYMDDKISDVLSHAHKAGYVESIITLQRYFKSIAYHCSGRTGLRLYSQRFLPCLKTINESDRLCYLMIVSINRFVCTLKSIT